MLNTSGRLAYVSEHEILRDRVRKFLAAELVPHLERFTEEDAVDRTMWRALVEADDRMGLDARYNPIIDKGRRYVGSKGGGGLGICLQKLIPLARNRGCMTARRKPGRPGTGPSANTWQCDRTAFSFAASHSAMATNRHRSIRCLAIPRRSTKLSAGVNDVRPANPPAH
jgi:hypothetical protein